MTKGIAAMLVYTTKECNYNSIVRVYQHGGYDVTCKPIIGCNNWMQLLDAIFIACVKNVMLRKGVRRALIDFKTKNWHLFFLKISLIYEEVFLQSHKLTKHGVKTGVAMATSISLDVIFLCRILLSNTFS